MNKYEAIDVAIAALTQLRTAQAVELSGIRLTSKEWLDAKYKLDKLAKARSVLAQIQGEL